MKTLTVWMAEWGAEWIEGREELTSGAITEFQAQMLLDCMRAHGRVVRIVDRWADALYNDYAAQGGAAA